MILHSSRSELGAGSKGDDGVSIHLIPQIGTKSVKINLCRYLDMRDIVLKSLGIAIFL